MDIQIEIGRELGIPTAQVEATLALLKDGATVPFIARYRKEKTGNLDETQIREISHRFAYHTELEDRRETVLDTIRAQGKLTPELEAKIRTVANKTELEDLYLPFKPKRSTRASKAKRSGTRTSGSLAAGSQRREGGSCGLCRPIRRRGKRIP